MGNNSSQDVITFRNCSTTGFNVVSKSNGSKIVPKGSGSSCGITSFPLEANDFTMTADNGQIYTLLGSSISSMNYSDVFIWENIVKSGSTIKDDIYYYYNGNHIQGYGLTPGIHVSFNNQSIAAYCYEDKDNNFVVTQIDFTSVLTYDNPPAAPDKSTKSNKDNTTTIKVPILLYVAIIMVVFAIASAVAGFLVYKFYQKKKQSIHTSSNG